jgi:hypothetical protein
MELYPNNQTIKAEFIQYTIGLCEEKYHNLISDLLETLAHDISNPLNDIPLVSFFEMCNLLESKIGRLQTKFIARNLGSLLYEKMVKQNIIEKRPHPIEMVKGIFVIMNQFVQNCNLVLLDSDSIRFGAKPCAIIEGEYALWRTETLNVSVRQDASCKPGELRHLGWEDSKASGFSKDTDVNGIVWERFTAQQQADEINEIWSGTDYHPK